MGLIKAAIGATSGVLADQWRDYFYCNAMDAEILATKGHKRISDRSSNTKSDDNIISNGSIIAVNEGQCVIIVDQGKVTDICAEPGVFIYDSSTEPSIFYGSIDNKITIPLKQIGERLGFGGDPGQDQRVYFFNMKEIIGNKFGTAVPIPFRVVDSNIGLDIDIAIKCNGVFSYRLVNPLLFYSNVCGNIEEDYSREQLEGQLKSELLSTLQPALTELAESGIRYSAIPNSTTDLCIILRQMLSTQWRDLRGIEIASIGINSISASDECIGVIQQLQTASVMRDPTMAAASIVAAQSDAMRIAAANDGGAFAGFTGVGFANLAGGMTAQRLFDQTSKPMSVPPEEWICVCGHASTGSFCSYCGKPRSDSKWICRCGEGAVGNYCSHCGAPRCNVS